MPMIQVDRDLLSHALSAVQEVIYLPDLRRSQRAPIESLLRALAEADNNVSTPADSAYVATCPSCGVPTDTCSECGETIGDNPLSQPATPTRTTRRARRRPASQPTLISDGPVERAPYGSLTVAEYRRAMRQTCPIETCNAEPGQHCTLIDSLVPGWTLGNLTREDMSINGENVSVVHPPRVLLGDAAPITAGPRHVTVSWGIECNGCGARPGEYCNADGSTAICPERQHDHIF